MNGVLTKLLVLVLLAIVGASFCAQALLARQMDGDSKSGSPNTGSPNTGSPNTGSAERGGPSPIERVPSRQALLNTPEELRDGDWYESVSLRDLAEGDRAAALKHADEGADRGSARAWAIASAIRVSNGESSLEPPKLLLSLRPLDPGFARARAFFRWVDSRRGLRVPDPDRVVSLRVHGPWPESIGASAGARGREARERWFSAQRSTLIRALTRGPGEADRGQPALIVAVVPYERSLDRILVELQDAKSEFPSSSWLPVILRVKASGEATRPGAETALIAVEHPIVVAVIEGQAPWSNPAFLDQRVWLALSPEGEITAVAPPGMPLQLLSLWIR